MIAAGSGLFAWGMSTNLPFCPLLGPPSMAGLFI